MQQNMFANIDTSGDGQISPDELLAFGQNLPGPQSSGTSGATNTAALFSQIDTDGDGSISQDELAAFGNKLSASNNSTLLQAQEGTGNAGHAHHHHHAHGASQTTSLASLLGQPDPGQDSAGVTAQAGPNSAAATYAANQSGGGSSLDPLLQLIGTLVA
jgi:hypothetical protein